MHLCVVCKGEGREFIQYNARVIDQTCESCEGVGTITTKNGVKITDEEAAALRREQSSEPTDKIQTEILKLEGMQKKVSPKTKSQSGFPTPAALSCLD